MKNRICMRAALAGVLVVLAVGTAAVAQAPGCIRLSGVINDYTPQTVKPVGPWEVRGPWSLRLNGDSGTADFSASLTMELSDYSQSSTTVNTPGARMQHTHHITMEGGSVTALLTGGFEISGPVTITKDGSPAPLAASTLLIDVTGGTTVEFSNITLTFQSTSATGAPLHFGPNAIHGVVRKVTHGND